MPQNAQQNQVNNHAASQSSIYANKHGDFFSDNNQVINHPPSPAPSTNPQIHGTSQSSANQIQTQQQPSPPPQSNTTRQQEAAPNIQRNNQTTAQQPVFRQDPQVQIQNTAAQNAAPQQTTPPPPNVPPEKLNPLQFQNQPVEDQSQKQVDSDQLQEIKEHVGQASLDKEYVSIQQKSQQGISPGDGQAMTKLVIYVIPIVALILQLLQTYKSDRNVSWHIKQSLVAQGVWLGTLFFIRLLDLPTISELGATIWNIACYILLILAGAQAYNNSRYEIPLVYNIGKTFIEDS
ncbi:MAG: hypothetical protein ACOCXT_00775 [Candidatus Dojkabacteria bacterium]